MLEVLEQSSPTTSKFMKRSPRAISRIVVQSQSKPQVKLQHMQNQIEQLEEEHAKAVKDLEDQIKALKRKVHQSEKDNKRLKLSEINYRLMENEIADLNDSLENCNKRLNWYKNEKLEADTEREIMDGLSLNNLLNEKYHREHPKAAREYFGFNSFKVYLLFTEVFTDDIYCANEWQEHNEALKDGPERRISVAREKLDIARRKKLEGLTVGLLYMRQGFQMKHLRAITGWGKDKVAQVVEKWVTAMGDVGKVMCNFPVDVEFANKVKPEEWEGSEFYDCLLIGDGRDHAVMEVRSNAHIRDFLFSTKIKSAALRGLSWMCPMGLYCAVTGLMCGRFTEPCIFKTFSKRLDFVPATHRLLYDKGLGDMRYALKNLNSVCTPSFLQKREAFGARETESNRELARLRYTVEVGYSRIYDFKMLRDVIPYHCCRHANSAWYFAHFMANTMQKLRK